MYDHQHKTASFGTKILGQDFFHYKNIDSTQTQLKKLLLDNVAKHGTLILADSQSIGKGTQGRTWHSLPKPQLMFSVLLQPELAPQKLPFLNILSGILMIESFPENPAAPPMIKWPNDIYIDSKKVAGILSELVVHEKQNHIILGVGLNTDAERTDFPPGLRDRSTALNAYFANVDRFKILETFLQKLEKFMFDTPVEKLIEYTQEKFEKLWMYRNDPILVMQQTKTSRGIAKHIDQDGALLLETSDGVEKIIHGTITLA